MEESPTELFPTCISNYIQLNEEDDVLLALIDYLAPLVVASSGVIIVIPDTLGYGESYQYNRTYLLQVPSAPAAWTVSYLAAQQYIRDMTGGCTELSQTTAVGGYGHGGYEAVLAARSLERLGLKILKLYLGGAVLKLPTQMSFWLQQLGGASSDVTSSTYLESMTLLWAFSYSEQEIPSTTLASTSWTARILQLSAPDPSVPVLNSNDNLLDIIHPDIVDFFEVRTYYARSVQCLLLYQYFIFHRPAASHPCGCIYSSYNRQPETKVPPILVMVLWTLPTSLTACVKPLHSMILRKLSWILISQHRCAIALRMISWISITFPVLVSCRRIPTWSCTAHRWPFCVRRAIILGEPSLVPLILL